MKDFKLNTESPWLPQLKRLEYELIQDALRSSNGNKAKASRLLGMLESTLRKRVSVDSNLKKIADDSKPKRIEVKNRTQSIISYFLLGLSIREIADKTRCRHDKVMDMLSDKLGTQNCKQINNTNELMRNDMETEQIIENNRQLLATIAESIRENKELSPENLVYAKILFSNGFITEKGEVTEEGKEALYH